MSLDAITEGTARFAVYWVPPRGHPLWLAGSAWLGRNPEMTDWGVPPLHAAQPWHYGFHATLKAPFRLRAGTNLRGLCRQLLHLMQAQRDFDMPRLEVQWLAGFLALRPAVAVAASHPLRRLADACVKELDDWRAPADPDERQRRSTLELSDDRRALLARWGYPHVLSCWRFHMTLSDSEPLHRADLERRAIAHFGPSLRPPLRAGGVALFAQLQADRPFVLVRRFSFVG